MLTTISRYDVNLEARGTLVWKADSSNSVRRMSNINENLLTNTEANPEKTAKLAAIKDFDESTYQQHLCGSIVKLVIKLQVTDLQLSVASTALTTLTRLSKFP